MGTVLITGVGREGQVGEAVAQALAARGDLVILVDRNVELAQARAKNVVAAGFRAFGYGCDLSSEAGVATLAERVKQAHGEALDSLVLLAGGFAMSGPVAESALDVWEMQITINLRTAYLACRAFLPFVRRTKGSVVFFASAGVLPGARVAEMSAYAMAKSGVIALMNAVAQEEQKAGVRANAVAPTSIRTAANLAAMGDNMRYVEREEVASVVSFLTSDASSAITGQVIKLG